MHDEFERALGVRRRRGLSPLGWIGVGLLTLMVLGATGAVLAYRMVSQEVQEIVERVQLRAPVEAPGMVARTVARTLGEMGTIPSVEEEDVASALSRALTASGGTVSGADVSAESAGPVEPVGPGSAQAGFGDDEMEGFLRIRTDEGEIRAELRAGEDGGRLVVRGPDDQVLVDLSGDARGARLYLRGEGEVAGFRTGEHAEASPAWVPRVDGPTEDLQRVVSGQAGEGTFGAETWRSDTPPEALVDGYRARLEAEGWTIRAEHELRDRHGTSVSVVGFQESGNRMAVLTADREDGSTRAVLGWGEADPR